MAIKDILAYIQANKKTTPLETLISQLRQSGYPEEEIQAALKIKDAAAVPAVSISSVKPAWKKILAWFGGFLAGVLASGIFSIVQFVIVIRVFRISTLFFSQLVSSILGITPVILSIFIFIRIRKRHPHFSYGLLTATIIYIVVLIGSTIFSLILYRNFSDAREKSRDRRYSLPNDINPGNQLYEVSESPISSSSLKNSAITPVFDNSPRIIIINPHGNVVWKIGEPHVITWETEGFTARNVNIYLYGLGGMDSQSAIIARDLSNTGKYAWDTKMITLYTGNSAAVSAGRYRIFILSNLNQNDSRTSVNTLSEGWITLEL